MNKKIFFACLWVLIGCSNHKEFTPSNSDSTVAPQPVAIEDAYALLIQEKIQDHIDKQKLRQQYPNFKVKTDSTATLYIEDKAVIETIELLDPIPLENEKTVNIRTVIIYENNRRDTIIASIKRTKVTIEGEETVSSKVILKNHKK